MNLKKHFFSQNTEVEKHWSGYTLFVIREKGLPFIKDIKKLLRDDGFDIIYEEKLSHEKVDKANHNIRGGNWNRGLWPISGGKPAYVIAVYDLHPVEVDPHLAEKHFGIENARITKTKIRDAVNDKLTKGIWCNALHSVDNAVEALEYSSLLFPDKIKEIETEIKSLNESFVTQFPVIKNISNNARRAKIEIVDYRGKEVICKTFKPGRERFKKREIEARDIGKDLNLLSEIITSGENYILFKKYDIIHPSSLFKLPHNNKNFYPLKDIKKALKIISFFRYKGYELIDLYPTNFLFDKKEGLKAIDFEFMQKGDKQTKTLRGSYALYGIPDNFSGDRPQGTYHSRPYKNMWFPYTGIPRFVLILPLPVFILKGCQIITWFFYSLYTLFKAFMKRSITMTLNQ